MSMTIDRLPTKSELLELLPSLNAQERDELDQLLAGLSDYIPYGAAKRLLECRAKEVVLSGPAGTGKSRGCLEYLNNLANEYPKMRGLIVRKTRESLSESGLFTFEEHVLGTDNPICSGVQRNVRQSYRYPNGSTINVGGMDKASKIMSTEYDVVYVQEAIELAEDDWESLTTRLRNGKMPYQQIFADTNPSSPTHWLKQRADKGKLVMMESRHEDNPILWDAVAGQWTERGKEYIATLDALTGVRFWRLRKGLWVAAEGVIYDEWDTRIHLLDRFEIPKNWRRIRVIDFGYTNPFVCQWWAIDPDGRMYLYREIYQTHRLVEDVAKQIKDLSQGESYEATIADHDAEDRATLERYGISTLPAKKEVSPGIQSVQTRIRKAGDGKPRLFLMCNACVAVDSSLQDRKKPTCTEQEIESYVWAKSADGKPNKEQPVKEDDHGMDAMRYGVMYVDRSVITGRIMH